MLRDPMTCLVARAESGIGGAIQALVCITIVASSAGASIQDPPNENLIPVSTAADRHGEINYTFDTTLNKGSGRYRTSLASGNLFKRLLSIYPEVHTLVVTYQFAGRTDTQPPSAVRLTLISDEYCIAPDAKSLPSQVMPLLVIYLGNAELRYPLDIAQKSEVGWNAPPQLNRSQNQNYRTPQVNVNTGVVEVHVHRSATAWLPLSDFLALTSARELRGTAAGLDFQFNEQVLAGLRQFAAEMQRRPIVY